MPLFSVDQDGVNSNARHRTIHKFDSVEQFEDVHTKATEVDNMFERLIIDRFNEEKYQYSAYVVRAEDPKKALYGFVFRVMIDKDKQLLPAIGQNCEIHLAHQGMESSPHYAEVTEGLFTLGPNWDEWTEFHVPSIEPKKEHRVRRAMGASGIMMTPGLD